MRQPRSTCIPTSENLKFKKKMEAGKSFEKKNNNNNSPNPLQIPQFPNPQIPHKYVLYQIIFFKYYYFKKII